MGKTSALGSLQLFLGRSISLVILAIGTIIVGWFIGEGDYGLYTIALIPATTFLLFQDLGVSTALTRYCAKYRAENQQVELRKIIIAGLTFEFLTGIVLSLVSVFSASFIAIEIGKPESSFLIVILSITIFMTAVSTATGGIFVGFEQMKFSSYSAIIQAVFFGAFSPLLVFLGYGALGAAIGFTIASVAGALSSLIFLYSSILRKLPPFKMNPSSIYQVAKPLLKYGIPLSIGGIIGGLLGPFFSFIMASYCSTALIGNYKIALNFTSLLNLLILPISTVLFPAFSKVDPQKEKIFLKNLYTSSVKYTVLLVVPATLALIVLAKPLIGTIYGNKWSYAPLFLALSVVYNLLALLGWRSMGSFLPAMGETKLLMKFSLLSLVLSIPLAYLLVPPLGIVGVILGVPLSGLPSTFIGLYISWKRYQVKADFRSSGKIFLASALAAIVVYAFFNFFNASYWILLVLGSILFAVVYLVLAPVFGGITDTDVTNLRTMFSSLGIISRMLEIPLRVIEKILKIRKS